VAEPITFYMDEHVPRAVTEGLRGRGVDVLRAQEAGMLEAEDERHLALALHEGRVIFTQDVDFLRLHAAGRPHAGIVYAPQGTPIGAIVRGLMLVRDVLSAEEMAGHVEFL
jgi:hypothetical protein